MERAEIEALEAICLMAAMADEGQSEAEREKLAEIFKSLDGEPSARIHERVTLRRTSLVEEAKPLGSVEARSLAFEMAVSVCEADARTTDAERTFLDELRRVLAIDVAEAARVEVGVANLAAIPITAVPVDPGRDLDPTILQTAILAGALELLPQSLATMAIIPIQMRLVYRIGERYGFTLDRGHLTEFLAAAGLGLTSQVVENYVRRLLGRFLGRAVVGPAAAFASTWAIGTVAKSYYSSGRKLDSVRLRELFAQKLEEGRGLFLRHESTVTERARTVDVTDVASLTAG